MSVCLADGDELPLNNIKLPPGFEITIYAGNLRPWQILIPPGVAHGYKVLDAGPSLLIYATDRFYNPADEGRIAHDDPRLNYDWELQHK